MSTAPRTASTPGRKPQGYTAIYTSVPSDQAVRLAEMADLTKQTPAAFLRGLIAQEIERRDKRSSTRKGK